MGFLKKFFRRLNGPPVPAAAAPGKGAAAPYRKMEKAAARLFPGLREAARSGRDGFLYAGGAAAIPPSAARPGWPRSRVRWPICHVRRRGARLCALCIRRHTPQRSEAEFAKAPASLPALDGYRGFCALRGAAPRSRRLLNRAAENFFTRARRRAKTPAEARRSGFGAGSRRNGAERMLAADLSALPGKFRAPAIEDVGKRAYNTSSSMRTERMRI